MIKALKQEAMVYGNKLQVVPIEHLERIKNEIELFKKNEELNGFHEWIMSNLYCFDLPNVDFSINSIILVAVPHPAYAKLEFERQGKKYNALGLVASDSDNTYKYLNDFLEPKNFHMKYVDNIPMKKLAAQCGLAVYGRNNICYIEGMGSNFSLNAYYSDLPCENGELMQMQNAETCANCSSCVDNCPTGAIRVDRFLIDNNKCLSYFNEGGGEFPEWIPKSAHHCIYDCLKCQTICPMNKEHVSNFIGPIKFSEEETNMLLDGRTLNEYSDEFIQKAKMLGLTQWPDVLKVIPRNLRVLFEMSDANSVK